MLRKVSRQPADPTGGHSRRTDAEAKRDDRQNFTAPVTCVTCMGPPPESIIQYEHPWFGLCFAAFQPTGATSLLVR
jgi:hypothetical protein